MDDLDFCGRRCVVGRLLVEVQYKYGGGERWWTIVRYTCGDDDDDDDARQIWNNK